MSPEDIAKQLNDDQQTAFRLFTGHTFRQVQHLATYTHEDTKTQRKVTATVCKNELEKICLSMDLSGGSVLSQHFSIEHCYQALKHHQPKKDNVQITPAKEIVKNDSLSQQNTKLTRSNLTLFGRYYVSETVAIDHETASSNGSFADAKELKI